MREIWSALRASSDSAYPGVGFQPIGPGSHPPSIILWPNNIPRLTRSAITPKQEIRGRRRIRCAVLRQYRSKLRCHRSYLVGGGWFGRFSRYINFSVVKRRGVSQIRHALFVRSHCASHAKAKYPARGNSYTAPVTRLLSRIIERAYFGWEFRRLIRNRSRSKLTSELQLVSFLSRETRSLLAGIFPTGYPRRR